jgi:hypothetical protein
VSVGIDQIPHGACCDGRSRSWNDQQLANLLELDSGNWLDADSRAIELDLYLATFRKTDPITELARNHQTSCLVDGSSHAMDYTSANGSCQWSHQDAESAGLADLVRSNQGASIA